MIFLCPLTSRAHRVKIYRNSTSAFKQIRDHNFNGVFLQSQHTIDHWNSLNASEERILYAKERDQFLPFSIFYPKTWCLQRAVSRYVHGLVSSGLISQWESHYWKTYPKAVKAPTKQLNLHQIAGIIWIASVLYGLAVVTFVLELCVLHHRKIARIIDFLTLR